MVGGSGIYGLINLQNGHIYVGQAVNLKIREYRHLRELRKGKHGNKHLQRAFDKVGPDNFLFVVLGFYPQSELTTAEQRWLDRFPVGERYNHGPCADNAKRGTKLSAESKAKLSKSRRAIMTPEYRATLGPAIRAAMTPAVLEKMRKAALGKKVSVETRAKMSKSFRGRKHSPATREKMSRAHKAQMTPEFRAKLGLSRLGKKRKPHTEATKQKISLSKAGKKTSQCTPERREKIRRGHLRRWARIRLVEAMLGGN
jgi:group I intron endonuclease